MMGDIKVWADGNMAGIEISMYNVELANDFLIMEMYWISQEKLDLLEPNVYSDLLEEITKLEKLPSSKSIKPDKK